MKKHATSRLYQAQCCRCRNKHNLSDRVNVKTGPGSWSSRCPRCNAEQYFNLEKERAEKGAQGCPNCFNTVAPWAGTICNHCGGTIKTL